MFTDKILIFGVYVWLGYDEKLEKHKLNLHTDIVAIITDGASIMKKVGKIINIDQQLCFAHGVQLGVIEVLYKKLETAQQYDKEDENESDESDSCPEQDIYDSERFIGSSRNKITEASIGPLINKVRKIILLFRKSPTKNDILQQYIKTEFGKDIVLLKDCKTRWSSLLLMLERFYLLRVCIKKALIDIRNKDESLDLSHNENQMLLEIITALVPIKTTVEALCRQDSNLFTADIAINFMLKKLHDANNDISEKLYVALKFRMEERRTYFRGLLKYLHNGKSSISGIDFITVPSSTK